MFILGVDLGLTVCGYCICKIEKGKLIFIKDSQIKTPSKLPVVKRLSIIFDNLEKEIKKYSPRVIVMEKLYSHYRHPTTLGILGQVKGVISLLAYKKGLEVIEHSPTLARKSFLGTGSGNSSRVRKMAENLTGKKFISSHSADAYSLIVAFFHRYKHLKQLNKN